MLHYIAVYCKKKMTKVKMLNRWQFYEQKYIIGSVYICDMHNNQLDLVRKLNIDIFHTTLLHMAFLVF